MLNSPFPSEYMYDKILEYISRISNKDIRLVAETLFIENKEKLCIILRL